MPLKGSMVSDLYSDIDRYRIVSIVGYRGVGKDMLSSELAIRYLEQGYKFWSNQLHIWNDPLYIDYESWKRDNPRIAHRVDSSLPKYPNIRNMVVILSEAGRYLRKYGYFEDMFEFSRKLRTFYFFPSVRPPHEDLQTLLIYPSLFQFSRFGLGVSGGLWYWKVQDGLNKEKSGKFWYFINKKILGIYDTEDPTATTEEYLECVRLQIELEQKARNRDGVQSLEESELTEDSAHLATLQKRISINYETLLNKISKTRR